MKNDEVFFLSKNKNDEMSIFSRDEKSTKCLSSGIEEERKRIIYKIMDIELWLKERREKVSLTVDPALQKTEEKIRDLYFLRTLLNEIGREQVIKNMKQVMESQNICAEIEMKKNSDEK